jgi:hypothetical protein
MAHEGADALDGHLPIRQGGAEGVAQHVGMHRAEAGLPGIAAQGLPHRLAGKGSAAAEVAEDQGVGAGGRLFQPGAQGILGLEFQRDDPLPAALADETQGRDVAAPMDAVQGKVARLGHSQAAAGHHLDEGLIAAVLGHRAQTIEFVGHGCFGQPEGSEGCVH